MADAVLPAATAAKAAPVAVSGAALGLFPGVNADGVLFWALIGAAVSVWYRRGVPLVFNPAWFGGALIHSALAVFTGLVGSTMLTAIAPAYAATAPLALAPQWCWSALLSGAAHHVLPWAWSQARAVFERKGASNA